MPALAHKNAPDHADLVDLSKKIKVEGSWRFAPAGPEPNGRPKRQDPGEQTGRSSLRRCLLLCNGANVVNDAAALPPAKTPLTKPGERRSS